MRSDTPNVKLEALLTDRRWLSRLAKRLVKDASSADDLVQETIVRALEAPGDEAVSRGWLARVASRERVHDARRARARREREVRSARHEATGSTLEILEQIGTQRELARLVLELPEDQREVIALRFWNDLPPRKIAQRLGLEVETVKSRQKRALATLRQRLDAENGGDRARWLSALAPLANGARGPLGAGLEKLTHRASDLLGHSIEAAPSLLGTALVSTAVLKFALPVALIAGIAYVTTRDPGSDPSIEAQAATPAVTGTADLAEVESRANTRSDALASASSSADLPTVPVAEPALLSTSQVAAAIVEDRATGAPIAGATVARYPTAGGRLAGDRAWDVIDTSEADGRLEVLVDPVQPGAEEQPRTLGNRRHLFALASPEYGISFATLTEEYSPPKLPRRVRLSRAAGVKGRVHGAGVDGVDAISIELTTGLHQLMQESGSMIWTKDVVWRCAVDERGAFRLDGLPAGVQFAGRALSGETELWKLPDGLRLAPGESREVDWVIGAGSTIRVSATEESGGPAVGVQIALDVLRQRGWRYGRGLTKEARKVLTDTSGQAVFTGVHVGNWTLIVTEDQPSLRGDMPAQVELDDLSPARHSALANVPANVLHEVDVTRDDDTYVLDLKVYRGHYIHGQVLDWQGSPTESSVTARSDQNGHLTGERNSEGRFRIGPLLPGTYELKASSMGGGTDVPGETILARTGDTDVVVRLAQGSTLKGEIVDRGSGKPLPASTSYIPGAGAGGYTSTWGEPGLLDMGKIRPGAFSLVVKTEDGRVALYESEGLTPGEERQDVRIEVGERTQLDVHYGGAHPDVLVVLETNGIHLGQKKISVETPALLPVSPGVIDVEALVRAKDRSWTLIAKRTVTVIEGDTLRVDISEP